MVEFYSSSLSGLIPYDKSLCIKEIYRNNINKPIICKGEYVNVRTTTVMAHLSLFFYILYIK